MSTELTLYVDAYVGLGGNVGGRAAVVRCFDEACARLEALPAVVCIERSSLIASAPVGPISNQPLFVNGVARLVVAPWLEASSLLDVLLDLEISLGRIRTGRHQPVAQGPRPIDLDLLLFGTQCVCLPGCVVPHPRLLQRAFTLVPLQEFLGAEFVVPGTGRTLGEALRDPVVAAQRFTPIVQSSYLLD